MTSNLEEDTVLNKLSIQVSLDGFSFLIQDKNTNNTLESKHYNYKNVSTPEAAHIEIQGIFEQERALQQAFSTVTVLYINELFTFIPKSLFYKEKLSDYLKFNTKVLKTDFVAYDELPNLELVNVYIPFTNINNYFFDKFGSFSYFHYLTPLAHEVMHTSSGTEPEAVAYFHKAHFDLIIHQGDKLVLINTFSYSNPEDVLYYLLFSFEQLQLNPGKIQLTVKGNIKTSDPNYTLIFKYIRHVICLNDGEKNLDYLLKSLDNAHY